MAFTPRDSPVLAGAPGSEDRRLTACALILQLNPPICRAAARHLLSFKHMEKDGLAGRSQPPSTSVATLACLRLPPGSHVSTPVVSKDCLMQKDVQNIEMKSMQCALTNMLSAQ